MRPLLSLRTIGGFSLKSGRDYPGRLHLDIDSKIPHTLTLALRSLGEDWELVEGSGYRPRKRRGADAGVMQSECIKNRSP